MHTSLAVTKIALLIAIGTALSIPQVFAGPVSYTWTFASLGQGAWGGGALFADGSVKGNLPFSGGNGGLVALFRPTSWTLTGAGTIDICFDVVQLKGPPAFPPSFCFSDLGFTLPVTGTPIVVSVFGVPHILRATPVG